MGTFELILNKYTHVYMYVVCSSFKCSTYVRVVISFKARMWHIMKLAII